MDFNSQVLAASKKGVEDFGILILCVQADADSNSIAKTYKNKIIPATTLLNEQNNAAYCKIIVSIVPIQETESWMLADRELLKRKIGTDLSDTVLKITRQPEKTTRPKEVIEEAIRIAMQNNTRRKRRNFTIADLYLPVGQEISLEKLENLSSYIDFKNNLINAFKALNYTY